jgi:hypothetical protein
MNAPPVISSIGPPPELHADRVISEMVRWLANEAERLLPHINALLAGVLPASPRAQLRLVEKLRKIARPTLLDVYLSPGKRGRFKLAVFIWGVKPGARPQVYLGIQAIEGIGNFRLRTKTRHLLTVSHHAMSRLAQRCNVRTPEDLQRALAGMALTVIAEDGLLEGDFPPAGKCFSFPGGVAVLRRDAESGDLIVATVLEKQRGGK